VSATVHGLRDTLADPDVGFESSLKRMPELSPDTQPLQRDVLSTTLDYYKPTGTGSVGSTKPSAWSTTQDFLLSIGVISQRMDPRQYYTNTFVDAAAT
jgi:NitT/TauT family transport system substrate-binding protein